MKKLNKYLLIIVALMLSGTMISQSSMTGIGPFGHDAPPGSINTHYLGWLDSSIPLDFRTNNAKRMQIAKNGNITVMNQTFNNGGFVGIGTDINSNFYSTGAYSLLHLNGGNGGPSSSPYGHGFRTWMKYGTLITANKDLMYLGIKNNLGLDHTEAVISWSDNTTNQSIADYLVFKFTKSYPLSNAPTAARTEDGLEVARFAPNGNVGIGDFSNNGFGLNQDPTRKLDVDGTARLRQMPTNTPQVLITGVQQNTAGDYVLNYKDLSGNADEYLGGDGNWYQVTNGLDCDWESSGNDIYMGTPTSCATGNVGIGQMPIINSRLSIEEVADDGENEEYGQRIAISGYQPSITFMKYGIESFVEDNAEKFNMAVSGFSRGADVNYGIYGRAIGSNNTTATNYGVFGTMAGANPSLSWGGYFVGRVYASQGYVSGSDEGIKQNIEDIEGSMDILNQIDCRSYEFRTEEFPQLELPTGQHVGVIAQSVQAVLPGAVSDVHQAAQYDREGNLIGEAVDFIGVNYNELIPILIQATKEQQIDIDEKDERIAHLETQMEEMYAMMLACCEGKGRSSQSQQGENDIKMDMEKNVLKQNTPNPFDLNTTIEYHLAQGGKVMVKITDSRGQLIEVLVNDTQDQGAHQVQWQAKGITRGIYYYSLNINGEELVKRMVKL